MPILRRLPFLILCLCTAMLVTGAANAQMSCDDCDPYSSHCSDSCYRCRPGEDPGMCRGPVVNTTCGDDRVLGGNCLQAGCTPNFQFAGRQSIGFYGEAVYGGWWEWTQFHPTFACEHHTVDRVTQHDVNQCNLNPYWWDKQYCDDYVDYHSPYYTDHQPDCCGYPGYCNDWHSCF